MPRKGAKRKGKSGIVSAFSDGTRYDMSQIASDSGSNDNMSIISDSEESSIADTNNDDMCDVPQSKLEDSILEALEGISQKSAQGRISSMLSLRNVMVKKYMPSFILERYFTMCDSIEKNLKRGDGKEKATAADLAPLFCLQLGAEDVLEEVNKTFKPLLLKLATDDAVSAYARARCCLALGAIIFITNDNDVKDIHDHMQSLEGIFAGSYLKGDDSVPNVTVETAVLHVAALSAWTLLSTLLAPSTVTAIFNGRKGLLGLQRLSELFLSPHLEVRLTAGEALAVIFELGRAEDEGFAEDFASDVIERLRQLATDSHKYRAKKDRKQQRATFRDILAYIQEYEMSEVKVKFGRELLILDTWAKRKQYDTLCTILGPGMNAHLSENDMLRDIFEMEAPSLQMQEAACNNKLALERRHKRMVNAANNKARTIARGKHRDKRSDF